MKTVRVVVVGAGVIGFSTAVCVAEALPFCSVTVLAEKFSPDTTSDGAAGILFAAQFPADVLLAKVFPAFFSSRYQIFKDVPADPKPYWSDLVIGFRLMTDRELERFPGYKFGQAFTTVKCECSSYLPWLEKRFRKAGGKVQQRKVSSLHDLSDSYDLIINCSGLGSRTLTDDPQVYPVRGQVLKVEAPWLQHFIRDGDGKTYIYPGIHGVTVGGTRQEDDWRLEVDDGDTRSILERCSRLEPSLSRARVLSKWVGLRPGRRNPRLERELVQPRGRKVPVVHNYGHGGWGVTLAWGSALDALGLVRQCLHEMPPQAKL
uniref:D-aspartate oxidase n=1 Tax=Sphaeramia orbicularis TaxID=375764 RepID=A0A673BNM2_9TELE